MNLLYCSHWEQTIQSFAIILPKYLSFVVILDKWHEIYIF